MTNTNQEPQEYDVHIWQRGSGWADHGLTVNAATPFEAVETAMNGLHLASAYSAQVFEIGDRGPADDAIYYDGIRDDGRGGQYEFDKAWCWRK